MEGEENKGAMSSGLGILDSYCEDVKFAILSRLPHNLLCRLKCLSKDWYRLLSTDDFMRFYYNSRTQTTSPMEARGGSTQLIFSGIFAQPINAPGFPKRVSPEFLSIDEKAANILDPSLEFLHEEGEVGNFCIEGSCNGLLLCNKFEPIEKHQASDHICNPVMIRKGVKHQVSYHICNPLTKQWLKLPPPPLKLPPPPTSRCLDTTGIEFDPSSSFHFKVVRIFCEEKHTVIINLFTSKTGTWREFKATNPSIFNTRRPIVFVKDVIFCRCNVESMLMYHFKGEYHKVIRLPHNTSGYYVTNYWKSEGRLYFYYSSKHEIKIWVLAEAYNCPESEFEWHLVHNITIEMLVRNNFDVFNALRLAPSNDKSIIITKALIYYSDLRILFLELLHKVVSYDLATGKLTVVKDFSSKDWWAHIFYPYRHSQALFDTSLYTLKGN